MKQIILIFSIFTFFSACNTPVTEKPDPSLTPVQSIKLGAPSIEKEWTIQDYKRFNNYLDSIPQKAYPRISSLKSKKLFEKIVSSIHQPNISDTSYNVYERVGFCTDLQMTETTIMRKYVAAMQNGSEYSTEISYLMGLSIINSTQLITIANELIPTLDPNGESYEVQMQGIQQMRDGLFMQYDAGFRCLQEIDTYSDSDRTIMTEYLVSNAKPILSFLETSSKQELKLKLNATIKAEANKKIKLLLTKMISEF